jgi:hypothetical protein
MVYLLGVNHQVQHNGCEMTLAREKQILELSNFLRAKASKLSVSVFAEEFSEYLMQTNKATIATVRKAAEDLGIKHVFCDPDSTERVKAGIKHGDNDKRELFWLARLEDYKDRTIFFVCGDDHLASFHAKLVARGFQASILPERFGIGLPPLG